MRGECSRCCLPQFRQRRHLRQISFRRSIHSLYVPLSTLHPCSRDQRRMTRGQSGVLPPFFVRLFHSQHLPVRLALSGRRDSNSGWRSPIRTGSLLPTPRARTNPQAFRATGPKEQAPGEVGTGACGSTLSVQPAHGRASAGLWSQPFWLSPNPKRRPAIAPSD